jgi:hypothetical protein
MLPWVSTVSNFFKLPSAIGKSENERTSLGKRMERQWRKLNSMNCHPYKPYVVSLKSKALLTYINQIMTLESKQEFFDDYNRAIEKVCETLYDRFDPNMMYTFNNEIHLVFFYSDLGNYLYNGNVHKTITALASCATLSVWKHLHVDSPFFGSLVEFDQDYEVLNYIMWRQFDCKRNNLTLLYKCLQKSIHDSGSVDTSVNVNHLDLDVMEDALIAHNQDIPLEKYILGNIVKKVIVQKTSDFETVNDTCNETESTWYRKRLVVDNFEFGEEFVDEFDRYIATKYL